MITLGKLTVSDQDLAVIAHVVHNETPEEWATRAFGHLGESSVIAKIERHKASYLAAKDEPGYQTAAQRMAERRNRENAELAAQREKRDQAKADRITRLNAADTVAELRRFITDELM